MMPKPPKPVQPNPPPERSGTLIEKSGNFPLQPPRGSQPVERSGTLIGTDDDISRAFLSVQNGCQFVQPVAVDRPAPIPSALQQPQGCTAVPFRPTVRSPDALSIDSDDGMTDGELIRVRKGATRRSLSHNVG